MSDYTEFPAAGRSVECVRNVVVRKTFINGVMFPDIFYRAENELDLFAVADTLWMTNDEQDKEILLTIRRIEG